MTSFPVCSAGALTGSVRWELPINVNGRHLFNLWPSHFQHLIFVFFNKITSRPLIACFPINVNGHHLFNLWPLPFQHLIFVFFDKIVVVASKYDFVLCVLRLLWLYGPPITLIRNCQKILLFRVLQKIASCPIFWRSKTAPGIWLFWHQPSSHCSFFRYYQKKK